LERPVRELKAQGVPSFSTPAFTGSATLQDDVLAPLLLQDVAHREPGLTAPDDNDVVILPHGQLPRE
jgi:hypothetical protein